jgi:hypothetical protein
MKQKALEVIMNHPLATEQLKGLLMYIGSPETSWEEKTLACLASAYADMREQFPSPSLAAELDALYSNSEAVADRIQPALAPLVNGHTCLSLEVMGLTTRTLTLATQETFAIEWSKAFHSIDVDCTRVLARGRELCFLALEAATKRIHAALNNGTQN